MITNQDEARLRQCQRSAIAKMVLHAMKLEKEKEQFGSLDWWNKKKKEDQANNVSGVAQQRSLHDFLAVGAHNYQSAGELAVGRVNTGCDQAVSIVKQLDELFAAPIALSYPQRRALLDKIHVSGISRPQAGSEHMPEMLNSARETAGVDKYYKEGAKAVLVDRLHSQDLASYVSQFDATNSNDVLARKLTELSKSLKEAHADLKSRGGICNSKYFPLDEAAGQLLNIPEGAKQNNSSFTNWAKAALGPTRNQWKRPYVPLHADFLKPEPNLVNSLEPDRKLSSVVPMASDTQNASEVENPRKQTKRKRTVSTVRTSGKARVLATARPQMVTQNDTPRADIIDLTQSSDDERTRLNKRTRTSARGQ